MEMVVQDKRQAKWLSLAAMTVVRSIDRLRPPGTLRNRVWASSVPSLNKNISKSGSGAIQPGYHGCNLEQFRHGVLGGIMCLSK